LRKTILIVILLCCVTLCFNTIADSVPEKAGPQQEKTAQPMSFSAQEAIEKTVGQVSAAASATGPKKALTVLKQDSGTNLSEMNYTLFSAVGEFGLAGLGIGEVVKFNAPKPGWKLKGVQIAGWSGFNNTTKLFPADKTFLVEIRDSNGDLLYRYIDIQNLYFASVTGPIASQFDIPALPVNGDFFVVLYDRGSIVLGMELNNATGNSYFVKDNQLFSAEFKNAKTNETQKGNWLIRAVGE
jgi:hypothetical protein